MKLAFSTNAFTRHSLDDALAAIAHAGYAGVEILADKPHWYPDRFDPAVAAGIRRQLERLHLAVSNINANCTFGYFQDAPPEPFFEPSLIAPNPQHRADRIRMIQNTLHFAQAIGAANISITSGRALPTMPPDVAMKQLRESLGPVLETASKLGVRVGFECEPGLFIEWAAELRALIDNVGNPMLGANLDIGHSLVLGEDIPAVVKLLGGGGGEGGGGGRIWNCHIEDIPGNPPKHYHLIPGQGNLKWGQLKEALESIHYDRFLTVELYSYPDRPVEAAMQSRAFLRTVFGD